MEQKGNITLFFCQVKSSPSGAALAARDYPFTRRRSSEGDRQESEIMAYKLVRTGSRIQAHGEHRVGPEFSGRYLKNISNTWGWFLETTLSANHAK